jgi:hypothetical protein
MADLATTYHTQGRYAEAEPIDRYAEDENNSTEVLELQQEVLGEKHPDSPQASAQTLDDDYSV